MTNEAYLKMRYFVEECETEISGFGKVRPVTMEADDSDKPGYFGFRTEKEETALEIYDIEILPQIVSGVHATISTETLAKFLHEKMKKGESTADYKVWWHSHVDMEAYFSGTDVNTINGSTEFPYLISIVTNKRGDIRARFDMYEPNPFMANVDIEVQQAEDKDIRNWCRRQIRSKVKTESIPLVDRSFRKQPTYHDEFGLYDGFYDDDLPYPPIENQQSLGLAQDPNWQDLDDDEANDYPDWMSKKMRKRLAKKAKKNNSGFGIRR